MRTITASLALFIAAALSLSAQTKTTETTTSIDSASGRKTVTYSTTVTSEEDVTPRSHMIVVNPLKFFLLYNLSYFHRISNGIVVGGGFQIPALAEASGVGVNAEVRFHPSGRAMRGFYIAPNVSYNNFTAENDFSTSLFSIGVLAGWQWFPGDDFAIGLGIGVDRWIVSASDDDEVGVFDSYSGTVPALRFDLGYAW